MSIFAKNSDESRGVNDDVARRLLIYAFAADVLETIEQEDVKRELERITLARFVKEVEMQEVSS